MVKSPKKKKSKLVKAVESVKSEEKTDLTELAATETEIPTDETSSETKSSDSTDITDSADSKEKQAQEKRDQKFSLTEEQSPKPTKKAGPWWNRELALSTFISSLLVILAFGIVGVIGLSWFLNQDFRSVNWSERGPVTAEPTSLILEINNPDDNTLSFDKTIIISGKTAPKATVIISINENSLGLDANEVGDFSRVVDLGEGVNQLKITSFDIFGNSKSVEKSVYYSVDKI